MWFVASKNNVACQVCFQVDIKVKRFCGLLPMGFSNGTYIRFVAIWNIVVFMFAAEYR